MKRFRLDGSWKVDPTRNRIERDGACRTLEPRQMDVLVRLARTPGEVVSEQALLSDVWNDRFVVEHVVPKTISALRAALGESARAHRIIETVGRRGYRIAVPVTEWRAEVLPRPAGAAAQPALRTASQPGLRGAFRLAAAAALGGFLALPIAGGRHTEPEPKPRFVTAVSSRTAPAVVIKTAVRLHLPEELPE